MPRSIRVGWQAAMAAGVLGTALAACRPSTDLVVMPTPAGSQLELRRTGGGGDTTVLAVHFRTAASASVGSLTATVTLPTGWRFVDCGAAQGEPLLACKATAGGVRLAAAWVAGTHGGDLLTVRVARLLASADPAFMLEVEEMHDGRGRSLADSVGVRRGVAP
jgi:hypothetical protein